MNMEIEKNKIVTWIQGIDDEKTIEKILNLKNKNHFSELENQLIQKGLDDVFQGNIRSHKDIKNRLEARFAEQ